MGEISVNQRLAHWKQKVKKLNVEVYALYVAYRDPRTPWYAKLFIACVVAYALSPIDLIPDFIPVLGYVDDMLIIPVGIVIALRMIPPDVLTESRQKAHEIAGEGKGLSRVAAAMIIVIWISFALLVMALFFRLLKK